MVNRTLVLILLSMLGGVAVSAVTIVAILPQVCTPNIVNRPSPLPPGPAVPTTGGQRF